VRDDRPFGGAGAARRRFLLLAGSRRHPSRAASRRLFRHPSGDAYAGFNALYAPDRKGGPIHGSRCWALRGRKLFELPTSLRRRARWKPDHDLVRSRSRRWKFDAIFALERSINGFRPGALAARRKDIAPLVNDLIDWMKRDGPSSRAPSTRWPRPMDYMLKRIDVFTAPRDGRICLSNNAAERELRGMPLAAIQAVRRLRSRRRARRGHADAEFTRPSSTTSIPKPGSPTCSARITINASQLEELLAVELGSRERAS